MDQTHGALLDTYLQTLNLNLKVTTVLAMLAVNNVSTFIFISYMYSCSSDWNPRTSVDYPISVPKACAMVCRLTEMKGAVYCINALLLTCAPSDCVAF